jgi:hypothetical protein
MLAANEHPGLVMVIESNQEFHRPCGALEGQDVKLVQVDVLPEDRVAKQNLKLSGNQMKRVRTKFSVSRGRRVARHWLQGVPLRFCRQSTKQHLKQQKRAAGIC